MRQSSKQLLMLVPLAFSVGGCSITPTPLDDATVAETMRAVRMELGASARVHAGEITIADAVLRALAANLDRRVAAADVTLRQTELGAIDAQRLPSVVLQAGTVGRDTIDASGLLDFATGVPFAPATTSVDRRSDAREADLSWHVLDFALSYVRARQAADRTLIAEEHRRKTEHRIVAETRSAYGRALAYERMAPRLQRLEVRAQRAIQDLRRMGRGDASSPMVHLAAERELVAIRQTAERMHQDLSYARAQLAALINVAPNSPIRLSDRGVRLPAATGDLDVRALVHEALTQRPELRVIAYQKRISEQQALAALLETLPGLRLHGADHADSTSFLLHQDWRAWGIAASGNLLRLLDLPQRRAVIDADVELQDQRGLAMTMAIITQVYLSVVRTLNSRDALTTARDLSATQRLLVEQIKANAAADLIGEHTLIREEMRLAIADLQVALAVSDLENAHAVLDFTVGRTGSLAPSKSRSAPPRPTPHVTPIGGPTPTGTR